MSSPCEHEEYVSGDDLFPLVETLREAVAPFVGDVQRTLEPTFTLRFVEDSMGEVVWLSESRWGETGAGVPARARSDDGGVEQARADLATSICENDFDEVLEPWPRCPVHRDHPLNPRMRSGRAVWACDNGADIAIPIGELEVGLREP